MEKNIFDITLEKACTSMEAMSGVSLTPAEGRLFIQLFDAAESYLTAAQIKDDGYQRAKKLDITPVPVKEPKPATIAEILPDSRPVGDPWSKYDEAFCQGKTVLHTSPPCQVFSIIPEPDPQEKATDIEAAYHQRDLEQAAEHDRIETQRREVTKDNTDFITTQDKLYHQEGYMYQLAALHRMDRSQTQIRLYKGEPTPEAFVELYKFYDQHTHYVFLNKWNNQRQVWENITSAYMLVNVQVLKNLRSAAAPWANKNPKRLDHDAIYESGWEKTNCAWRVVRSDWKPEEFRYLTQEPTRVQLMKHTIPGRTAEKQQRPEYFK